jgi:hypothetical protein
MLSCTNTGIWPDLALRLNKNDQFFTGGELIELKDAKGFNVSSFNSTIPLGKKDISSLIVSKTSQIRQQMEEAGDDILSHKIRDVYYLIRGNKDGVIKVCLTHGKFFETISEASLVGGAFSQMLEERIAETKTEIPEDVKANLISIFNRHDTFAQSRKVEKASVKLRFRIMTEVAPEGNVLLYPEISDNSLTLLIPYQAGDQREQIIQLMKTASDDLKLGEIWKHIAIHDISHKLNGPFVTFQIQL